MNIIIGLFLLLSVAGCNSFRSGEIKDLVTDPHFTEYQNNMDALESSYLKGEIKYPEYLDKKKKLEDTYTQQQKKQENIILNNE